MVEIPVLTTRRLILRPFKLSDACDVQRLAGDKEIAANTLLIPHPYEDGMAEDWISTHRQNYQKDKGVAWAVVHRVEAFLIGAIGIGINREHSKGELGYWIGKPYWSNNYATEAGKAVLEYGFTLAGLNRIYSRHLSRNPASGRVMQKLGMKYEGCLRSDALKWGQFEDIIVYGILESEYHNSNVKQ